MRQTAAVGSGFSSERLINQLMINPILATYFLKWGIIRRIIP